MRAQFQLMFQGDLDAALELYVAVFDDLKITPIAPDGSLREMTLCGQTMRVFNSPPVHEFSFTPSITITLDCDSPGDVDRIAGQLSEGGKVLMPPDAYEFSPRFAWVEDPFGVSWQIGYFGSHG